MKIGFTGTQIGMTDYQKEHVTSFILTNKGLIFSVRHGDCVGADAEFHQICRNVIPHINIVGHPPVNDVKRAFCVFNAQCEPKEYIARNHDIVDNSDVIIACPKERIEVLRSGTWATIRYARKSKKRLVIIYPE